MSNKDYIRKLIDNDIAGAQDNLYRARMSFRGQDLAELYGESGKTKGQIIGEYEEWLSKAEAALAALFREDAPK